MEYTSLLFAGSFQAKLDIGLAIQSGSCVYQGCQPGAGHIPLTTDSL